MSEQRTRQLRLAKLFGGALLSQVVLSAANFAVGILLVRHVNDLQYGQYVLALNALNLLTSLQNAFLNPPLARRLGAAGRAGRADLVGGLYRAQGQLLPWLLGPLLLGGLLAWWLGGLDWPQFGLLLAGLWAGLGALQREYFRMVLSAYRLTTRILRADLLHVGLLLAGIAVAIQCHHAALVGMLGYGLAAFASSLWLRATLRAEGGWNRAGQPGLLAAIAPLSLWSTAGSGVHWAFSQGFMVVVAALLGPVAVAALAATRLLLMPVNLLSNGIGSLLLPMSSGWLATHGLHATWRRLTLMAVGMALAAGSYFVLVWCLRDWIFTHVLHKSLVQRDALLLWWGAVFLSMVVRDQLLFLLVAHGRFKVLTVLTLVAALCSLLVGGLRMQQVGVTGALQGLFAGEALSVAAIVLLSLRMTRMPHRLPEHLVARP